MRNKGGVINKTTGWNPASRSCRPGSAKYSRSRFCQPRIRAAPGGTCHSGLRHLPGGGCCPAGRSGYQMRPAACLLSNTAWPVIDSSGAGRFIAETVRPAPSAGVGVFTSLLSFDNNSQLLILTVQSLHTPIRPAAETQGADMAAMKIRGSPCIRSRPISCKEPH
ncbi:hypothetical protein D9M68_740400 [compost metagenome]